MEIFEIQSRMIEASEGNLHDVAHFMKVWGYARLIGRLERLAPEDQYLLEAAAVVHDIACPLCREKYGNTEGRLQELESPELISRFFAGSDLAPEQLERISLLVSHHHTWLPSLGEDHQILLEADYLVNADESGFSRENLLNTRDRLFRTASGKALLNSLYRL